LDPGNRLTLAGTLVARDALRYTPAGIPIVRFRLAHASRQHEAGTARTIEMEMACVATEELARLIAATPLGAGVNATGFIARKGRSSGQLVLHVTELDFREGDRDASSQQRT
jgi:primosomal replication protein N